MDDRKPHGSSLNDQRFSKVQNPDWLLTFIYEPKFCRSCGAAIGRRVLILEYTLILFLAAVVWAVAF
jgi:hypothetical protein